MCQQGINKWEVKEPKVFLKLYFVNVNKWCRPANPYRLQKNGDFANETDFMNWQTKIMCLDNTHGK